MSDYEDIIVDLFTEWYENEISKYIKSKNNLQLVTGSIAKQNVGSVTWDVIQSSNFEFEYIPISLNDQIDLKEVTLSRLVTHLPWDQLDRSMSIARLQGSGVNVNANLALAIQSLVSIGVSGNYSDQQKKQARETLTKELNLKELFSIIDVVNLFFQWSDITNMKWKDGVYFSIHSNLTNSSYYNYKFKDFLNEIALDHKKRVMMCTIVNEKIDFDQITNSTKVETYVVRTDYKKIAQELLEIAKSKEESFGRWNRVILRNRAKKYEDFRNNGSIVKNLPEILKESQYDTYRMKTRVGEIQKSK